MISTVTRVFAKLLRLSTEDERPIRLGEAKERDKDHGSLKDGCRPEHPSPGRAKGHETTYNGTYIDD